ncbi:MAG: PilZ domain-containing protein [Candidatus Rifleibacteriota bacterium]
MINLSKLLEWISGTRKAENKDAADLKEAERRRFQRLQLHNCKVFIGEQGPFPILNLSYGGMRLDLSNYKPTAALKTGQKLNCSIFLEKLLIDNETTLRNLSNNIAGCSFSPLSITESRMLKDFIKPRILGCSLREIENAKLKNDNPDLNMRWFQGKDGTQFFLWQTLEGRNVMQEFYFLDYFISWKQAEKELKTGLVRKESRGGFGRISPDSIVFFNIPSYRALKLGKIILEISQVPDEAKKNLIQKILGEEKRLYHRYLVKEKGISFITEGFEQKNFPVINLSLNGIALLCNDPEQVTKLSQNNKLPGKLILPETSIQIAIQPAYFENNCMGGTFRAQNTNDIEKYSKFLAPRLLGQYLELVPAPVETPPFAPAGSQSSLMTGLHNTHVLTLLSPDKKLISGRIAFMQTILRYDNNKLQEFESPKGFVFPGDWDLPSFLLNKQLNTQQTTLEFCLEMVESGELDLSIKKAWIEVLKNKNC